jgi:hypothetical protein
VQPSQVHKAEIQKIVKSGNLGTQKDHFLACHARNPIIYGADKPQRLYLQLLLFAQGNRKQRPDQKLTPPN